MTTLAPHPPIAEPLARGNPRDLRAMMNDGAAFSVMVGLGETYFPVFALAAGYGAAVAGWLTTLPLLAGGLLQLVTPYAVARLDSFRRWVVACALIQGLSFLPLVLAGLQGRVSLLLLFTCATLYWAFGLAAGPAWNTWVETLIPPPQRPGFFARRARWCQIALLLTVLAGGFSLELDGAGDHGLTVFAVLFGLAAAARGVSALCLGLQSESREQAVAFQPRPAWAAWRALRGSDAERLLLYLLAIQVAVNLASPFFTPYMLGTLTLSYAEYTLLTSVAFGARVAVLPFLGQLAHSRGNRSVLWLGAVGIVPLPALWLLSDSLAFLLLLQILAGIAWACLELSTLLSFFEILDPDDRPSVLSAYNLGHAVAMSAGALAGGWLLQTLGPQPATYAALFLVSTLGRGLSLLLLRHVSVTEAPLDASSLRTLAVRPSLGAVQRPILAALPDDAPIDKTH